MSEVENTNLELHPEASAPDAEAPKAEKKAKKRKKRSTGKLALAFVEDNTLAGETVPAYKLLPGLPDFETKKDAMDHIKDLVENDAYSGEFEQMPIAIVRLVGEPMIVSKEVKTTVSFN